MQFTAPYSFVSAGNLAVHLHPEHLADLRASGLSDETIRAARVYSLPPCRIDFFFRHVPPDLVSALSFPYQGGEFARIKLFPALGKMKYAQPPKTGARLYMPFPIGDGPVFVVEGEKKTLAARQEGLNAAGIGGVWNWLSNGAAIDDLSLLQWDGREVTIIPDSDVFKRVDLMRAIYALGRELRGLGANVYVAQLPQPGAAKIGLDDFLVAGGRVSELEVFSLSHRRFKGMEYWHGQWKFQKALKAA
jgi:putative DNA primase/helicase